MSPSHCESGVKGADHSMAGLTDGRTSKSDSSSDEERSGVKTGQNNSIQNTLSPSQSQKRPMNAFLIFCKRHRSVVRQKYPHLENRSITKILGEWWAALDSDQKLKYTELARQYKEAFMKANPHFKWYKTTDLRPPIPPASPPLPPPPPVAPTILVQNSTQSQPQPQQNQIQSTPKPPKKRYLETLENGDYVRVTNNANNIVTKVIKTCSNAGPPILDIETANRVIENALSGSLSVSSTSNSVNTNREQSAFNADIINGHINSVLEQHTIETRELEALERSSHNRCPITDTSNHSNTSNTTQSTTNVDKSPTNSISNPVPPSPHTMPSDVEPEPEEENNEDDDKPLNLSASTVLHTSNQHIIDHFIDKLLSTGTECSSSEPLSLPFTSPPLSSMSHNLYNSSGNDTNNKINNNNNDNKSNNNNNNRINNNCNSLSTTTTTGHNSANRAQSRKDRSCKGKRYLEILNENKFGKRSRNVSPMVGHNGAGGDKEDGTAAKNSSSNQSSAGTGGSKWVSGGFDLEEHIAQLPQLGDTHLLNALSHSKANKQMSCSQKSGSNGTNDSKSQKCGENCVNESNNNCWSDRSNSDIEDNNNDTTGQRDQFNDNTLRNDCTTDSNTGSKAGADININNKQTVSETQNENSNQNTTEDKHKTDDSIGNTVNNTSDLVNNSLPTTQGIEFSDGLAALAEVALQQQRNTV